MTYSYDYAGRLFEKSGQIEGKKYTEEYKYSYTSQNLLFINSGRKYAEMQKGIFEEHNNYL